MSEIPLYPDECGHRRQAERCWECLTLENCVLSSALRIEKARVVDLERTAACAEEMMAAAEQVLYGGEPLEVLREIYDKHEEHEGASPTMDEVDMSRVDADLLVPMGDHPADPDSNDAGSGEVTFTTPKGRTVKQGDCLCILTAGCEDHDRRRVMSGGDWSAKARATLDMIDRAFDEAEQLRVLEAALRRSATQSDQRADAPPSTGEPK